MYTTKNVRRCILLTMYGDIYYQKCTEMYTTKNVRRCVLPKMYGDVYY